MIAKSPLILAIGKEAFYRQIEMPLADASSSDDPLPEGPRSGVYFGDITGDAEDLVDVADVLMEGDDVNYVIGTAVNHGTRRTRDSDRKASIRCLQFPERHIAVGLQNDRPCCRVDNSSIDHGQHTASSEGASSERAGFDGVRVPW